MFIKFFPEEIMDQSYVQKTKILCTLNLVWYLLVSTVQGKNAEF